MCAKLYEILIKKRLVKEIEENGDFSKRQFGFRKNRSTIQAVQQVVIIKKRNFSKLLVVLDIKNILNTASLDKIIDKIEGGGISRYLINLIDSYLSHRKVRVTKEKTQISTGGLQGLILSATLRNILYNGILNLRVPEGVTIVAYADDLVVLMEGVDKEELLALLRQKQWKW